MGAKNTIKGKIIYFAASWVLVHVKRHQWCCSASLLGTLLIAGPQWVSVCALGNKAVLAWASLDHCLDPMRPRSSYLGHSQSVDYTLDDTVENGEGNWKDSWLWTTLEEHRWAYLTHPCGCNKRSLSKSLMRPLPTEHVTQLYDTYIPIQAQPRLQRKRDKTNNSFRIGDCSQSHGRAAQGRREARVSPLSWSSELTTIVDNVASTNLSARRSKTSCSPFLVQP